jgi:hypothetical protein
VVTAHGGIPPAVVGKSGRRAGAMQHYLSIVLHATMPVTPTSLANNQEADTSTRPPFDVEITAVVRRYLSYFFGFVLIQCVVAKKAILKYLKPKIGIWS